MEINEKRSLDLLDLPVEVLLKIVRMVENKEAVAYTCSRLMNIVCAHFETVPTFMFDFWLSPIEFTNLSVFETRFSRLFEKKLVSSAISLEEFFERRSPTNFVEFAIKLGAEFNRLFVRAVKDLVTGAPSDNTFIYLVRFFTSQVLKSGAKYFCDPIWKLDPHSLLTNCVGHDFPSGAEYHGIFFLAFALPLLYAHEQCVPPHWHANMLKLFNCNTSSNLPSLRFDTSDAYCDHLEGYTRDETFDVLAQHLEKYAPFQLMRGTFANNFDFQLAKNLRKISCFDLATRQIRDATKSECRDYFLRRTLSFSTATVQYDFRRTRFGDKLYLEAIISKWKGDIIIDQKGARDTTASFAGHCVVYWQGKRLRDFERLDRDPFSPSSLFFLEQSRQNIQNLGTIYYTVASFNIEAGYSKIHIMAPSDLDRHVGPYLIDD